MVDRKKDPQKLIDDIQNGSDFFIKHIAAYLELKQENLGLQVRYPGNEKVSVESGREIIDLVLELEERLGRFRSALQVEISKKES